MKMNIPTPVVVVIVLIVVAVAGIFLFRGQSGNSAAAVAEGVKTLNQGKPQTEAVPASQASDGALLMGGPSKGRR